MTSSTYMYVCIRSHFSYIHIKVSRRHYKYIFKMPTQNRRACQNWCHNHFSPKNFSVLLRVLFLSRIIRIGISFGLISEQLCIRTHLIKLYSQACLATLKICDSVRNKVHTFSYLGKFFMG